MTDYEAKLMAFCEFSEASVKTKVFDCQYVSFRSVRILMFVNVILDTRFNYKEWDFVNRFP